MAEQELKVIVKLDSETKKQIKSLREQKRRIDKQLKGLKSSVKDESKLEEWKMLHTLKQEIVGRLKKQDVSWNKFVSTPDWFDYAYVKQVGDIKRIITSIDKPPASATKASEADMISLAKEQRSKIVRRKSKRKSKKTTAPAPTGKQQSIAKANIS